MRNPGCPWDILKKILSRQKGPKMQRHVPDSGQGGVQVQAIGAETAPKSCTCLAVAPESCLRGLLLLVALFSREGWSLSSCRSYLHSYTALQCLPVPRGFSTKGDSDLHQPYLAVSADISCSHWRCYWYQVDKGQGCCKTSYSVQEGATIKNHPGAPGGLSWRSL